MPIDRWMDYANGWWHEDETMICWLWWLSSCDEASFDNADDGFDTNDDNDDDGDNDDDDDDDGDADDHDDDDDNDDDDDDDDDYDYDNNEVDNSYQVNLRTLHTVSYVA